jgi:trehalose-6-phosphate synthase
MGIAKMEEDNNEIIDNRMRDSGRSCHGNTYINRYPDYPSRKSESTVVTYCVPQSAYRPTNNTYRPYTSTYRPTTASVSTTSTPTVITPKPTPIKKKIGYVQRDYEHYGIEIYFYHRPNEAVLDKLKDNGWHWHRQKKCWFRKYSTANQKFADKIIEQ